MTTIDEFPHDPLYNVYLVGDHFEMTVQVEAEAADMAAQEALDTLQTYYGWHNIEEACHDIRVEEA
jgi:hypothetical protein